VKVARRQHQNFPDQFHGLYPFDVVLQDQIEGSGDQKRDQELVQLRNVVLVAQHVPDGSQSARSNLSRFVEKSDA
jgi:hypothetical protein